MKKQLTDTAIKRAKQKEKEYKLADGDGLYLHITHIGTKWFKYRYTINGKTSTKSLGKYPFMSLTAARQKRDELKIMVLDGIRPLEKKANMVFTELINEYFENRSDLSEKYIDNNRSSIEKYFSDLLTMELDKITPTVLIDDFKRMNKKGVVVYAKKSGGMIDRIFRYGVTLQYCKYNPMRDIDLSILLQKKEVKNYAHITDQALFRELLIAIENSICDGSTKRALRLMPYVFLRPSNIRDAEWSEFDYKNRLWTIPAAKMKMSRDHIVPLTDTIIDILGEKKEGLVFPSPYSASKKLSENTLNIMLKRLGFGGVMTTHGFRHTASTVLHENIHIHGISSDVIEMQLAHVEKNSVKGVYNKALYMPERQRLMQWWSDYLDNLRA